MVEGLRNKSLASRRFSEFARILHAPLEVEDIQLLEDEFQAEEAVLSKTLQTKFSKKKKQAWNKDESNTLVAKPKEVG